MNLLTNTWIPVIRKDGTFDEISPLELLDDLPENPVVSLHTVRPDFDGALLQFLIGVYQVLLSPEDMDEWRDLLDSPPSRESLADKINLIAPAFVFDEGEFRFMQDKSVVETKVKTISKLLIDINSSPFIKETTIQHMCPKCAAMALITLELNSPSGGSGHMTSLRGGGPLTTLVTLPTNQTTLWKTIVLNLVSEDLYSDCGKVEPCSENIMKIFPWLASLPNSEHNEVLVPKDMHPYHVFWNVPRRVWINFSNTEHGHCDLCGEDTDQLLSAYWSLRRGINYDSWSHPWTPYYVDKSKSEDPLPILGKEDSLSYMNWVGVVLGSSDNSRIPAAVVRRTLPALYGDVDYSNLKIHAFGYAMENAKSRFWQEGIIPTFLVSPNIQFIFRSQSEMIIKTALTILSQLTIQINAGIRPLPNKQKEEKSFSKSYWVETKSRFWSETEAAFYTALNNLPKAISDDLANGEDTNRSVTAVKQTWLKDVRRITLDLFKERVLMPTSGEGNPAQAAKAELALRGYLTEKNPKLCKVLGLPVPQKKGKVKS